MASKDALIHAYAFYSGRLVDKYGRVKSSYPRSEYKTKTILNYLVKERDMARAKFLLGLLTLEENGALLIREASNDGDDFARVHDALQFACNGNESMAKDMLSRFQNISSDRYVRIYIDEIFDDGFTTACQSSKHRSLRLEYVLSFSN